MDETRESHEMYGSTSSDEQGSVTTVIHVDRGAPADQHQRRQRQTGSGDDGGEDFPDERRLSRRHIAEEESTDSDDDGHLMPSVDRDAASNSDSDSTLSETQDWVSRQSQATSKPTVPPKPQSFQSVAPPGRRNVALRVSMASEGSGAVETVAFSEPTVRNGSCVSSPTDAPIEILPPLPAMSTQGICPVDQTWTGVQVGSSLFGTLSCLYAVLLVVTGLVLSVAEVSKPQPVLLLDVFEVCKEWFFVYLFGMSIFFLLYVCLVVMGRPPLQDGLTRNNVPIEGSILRRWSRRQNNETHAASFYLRLGAVGFGIGAMIQEGLAFGQLFEGGIMSPCLDITEVIRSVLQLTFTFVQLYTIVLSSTACLHKHTLAAYFAYMHMAATNACVWLRVVVMETVMEVTSRHSSAAALSQSSTSAMPTFVIVPTVEPPGGNYSHDSEILQNLSPEPGVRCPRVDLMGHVVRAASPYLYPCTVQYSLVAGGILCVTWYGVSKCPLSQASPVAEDETKVGTKVDCRGTHYGLFCGLFTLVATIIAIIVFFVFLDSSDLVVTATLMLYTLEGALCGLAVVALIAATILMSRMKHTTNKTLVLDELLLMLSVGGVYVYCGFSIVPGLYHANSWPGMFLFLSCVIIVLQTTFQTVFIRCSLHRSEGRRRGSNKPGRECITFLIVINIALWGVTLFERLRTDVSPTARDFYGALLWSVITHIAAPLCLFCRFHSAVCLANIWNSAYKVIT